MRKVALRSLVTAALSVLALVYLNSQKHEPVAQDFVKQPSLEIPEVSRAHDLANSSSERADVTDLSKAYAQIQSKLSEEDRELSLELIEEALMDDVPQNIQELHKERNKKIEVFQEEMNRYDEVDALYTQAVLNRNVPDELRRRLDDQFRLLVNMNQEILSVEVKLGQELRELFYHKHNLN